MAQHIAAFLLLGKEGLFPPETVRKLLAGALNGSKSVQIDHPQIVHPGMVLTLYSSRDPFFEGPAGSYYTLEYGVPRNCSIAFDYDRDGNLVLGPRYYGRGGNTFAKCDTKRLCEALLEGIRSSQQYPRACQGLDTFSFFTRAR